MQSLLSIMSTGFFLSLYIYIEERIMQCLWCDTLCDQDTLPWRQRVGHVRESNRVPFSFTVRKKLICFYPSSCSNLAGCQCERKLYGYALKIREGIWMWWHALLHGGWDLNKPCLECDLTWLWNVSCIDCFVNGNVMCQLSLNNSIKVINYAAGEHRIRFSSQVISRVVICIN